jgi:hypothetical protein
MEGRRFVLLIALTVHETRERLQSPVAVLALSGERYL